MKYLATMLQLLSLISLIIPQRLFLMSIDAGAVSPTQRIMPTADRDNQAPLVYLPLSIAARRWGACPSSRQPQHQCTLDRTSSRHRRQLLHKPPNLTCMRSDATFVSLPARRTAIESCRTYVCSVLVRSTLY